MMLAGLPVPDDDVHDLADVVPDAGADELADRLERALADDVKLLTLTIDERALMLSALEDPPEGRWPTCGRSCSPTISGGAAKGSIEPRAYMPGDQPPPLPAASFTSSRSGRVGPSKSRALQSRHSLPFSAPMLTVCQRCRPREQRTALHRLGMQRTIRRFLRGDKATCAARRPRVATRRRARLKKRSALSPQQPASREPGGAIRARRAVVLLGAPTAPARYSFQTPEARRRTFNGMRRLVPASEERGWPWHVAGPTSSASGATSCR